jgi:hypothetical protein
LAFRPRWPWVVAIGVVAYFTLLLVTHAFPPVGGTAAFFLYVLSVPVVLMLLLAVGMWGGVGLLSARLRAKPLKPRHRAYVLIACVGLGSFPVIFGLARTLPRSLPTGSHQQRFDRTVWHDPGSADFRPDDITPRQKMLADVTTTILPGRTRAELEVLLGPSLDTGYFKSTGRDLIYVLGPQRDSWFAIDSEWLLVWLDKDGRFQRYAVVND